MSYIHSISARKKRRRRKNNSNIFRLLENISSSERILEDDSKRFLETASAFYTLTRSVSNVTEGGSVTFTLNALGTAKGTAVPYTITGVSSADINGASLSGNFIVNATGTSSLTLDITVDTSSEFSEVLVITAGNATSAVTINDQSSYILSRSASHVNEGEFVTFILNTFNVPIGTPIGYNISGTGITSNDIGGVPLSGIFVANSSGVESLTLDITADLLNSEGPEVLNFSVAGESTSVIINDSAATTPTYSLTRSPVNVNEGNSVTFTLTTANVAVGTSVPYTITGVSSADINNAPLTGNFVVNDTGVATVTFNVTLDSLNEDTEVLTLSLNGLGISVFVNLIDTSLPQAATYTLSRSPNTTSVNEGTSVTFTLTTKNVGTGTKVPYTITGVTTADINNAPLTGEFTVSATGTTGTATLPITISNDALTEGSETLTLTLDNLNVLPISVDINDTSQTRTYTLTNNATGGSVNEGGSVTFTLTTTNVANGTTVPYTITGVNAADIGGAALTGNFTVNSNAASLTLNITSDATTETTETLNVAINGTTASSSVTINDTSKTPTYALTNNATGGSVNEGGSITFTLTTTNVANGTTIPYSISGVSRADINNAALTGNFTVNGNTASLTLDITLDSAVESTETLTITAAGQTSSITINDKTPTYAITNNATGGSVNEGGSVTFTLTTTSVANNTTVPYTITGVTTADIGGAALTGNFTVGATGTATLALNITLDSAVESTETLMISAGGASSSITINDKTPTYTLTRSPVTSSVDEGTTITFTLTTTNVDNGTTVPYTITGVSSADINNAPLTGNFTVGATGTATLPITFTNDALTEGSETLTLTLNTPGTNSSVTINDTSKTPAPTYTLTRSPNSTTVDEGTTVTFTLATTNVSNGTPVPYTITGVSSADISGASLTGNFTVGATGTATLQITFSNDLLTEGSETAILTLNTPGTNISVAINDTSKTPAIWNQKGLELVEASPNLGGYGVSVSADGNVVVSTGRTSTSSFISVNRWDTDNYSWTNTKITIPVHSPGNAELQTSISDDGNVIACVYRNHNFEFPLGVSSNYAAVYEWNGNSWNRRGNNFATTSNQDTAVAISGDGRTVAITDNRQVKVYSWSGSVWNQNANTITYPNSDNSSGAYWAQYISLDYSGMNIAISASLGSRGVYIFTYTFNAWILNKYFATTGVVDAVTLCSTTDNRYIIAYASFASTTPYIAIHKSELGNTSGTWNSRGQITITGPDHMFDNPDISMSIDKDGNRVIWSTKHDYDINGDFTNSTIRVVDWNGVNWVQTGTITPDPPNSNSGYSIALSQDGQTIVFGAPNYNNVKVYSTGWNSVPVIDLSFETSNSNPPSNATGYGVPGNNQQFAGSPTIQSVVKRTGAQYSAHFPGERATDFGTGSNGMYGWPSTAWNYLDKDFVIDTWVYLPSNKLTQETLSWFGGSPIDFLNNAICGTGDPSKGGNVLAVWHPKNNFTNPRLRMYNMSGGFVESTVNFPLDLWVRVTVRHQSSTTKTDLFLNGALVGSSSSVSYSITNPAGHGNNFYIGGRDGNISGAWNMPWRGYISNFKLYTTKTETIWSQLGLDIDGEASGDQSGYSVSMNAAGNRIVIGAPSNDGNDTGNTARGHARTYSWDGNTWIRMSSVDLDGEATGDNFGVSVSMNATGNRMAIGAPGNDGSGTDRGHVRVYSWNGSSWDQLGLDIDGEVAGGANSFFGVAVSMNAAGDRLAVSAFGNDSSGTDRGEVRVYSWNGSSWVQLGQDINGEAIGDYLGRSVSMNAAGDRLAVSAIYNDGNGLSNSGHVRVYSWNGSSWDQLGLDIDGEAANDESGSSVRMNAAGDRIAIGAFVNGINRGHVRVYSWNGSSWNQLGLDIDGAAVGDSSGFSVSMNAVGDRIAIGAIYHDGAGTDIGHVRVYSWNDSSWVQLGPDMDGEAASDSSGYSVSMNAAGNRVAVSAIYNDGNSLPNSGHVRVYRLI